MRLENQVRCLVLALMVALAIGAAAAVSAQTPITFRYFYDDAGQLQKVIDSTGVVIEYVYDGVGNILEIKRSVSSSGPAIFNFTPTQGAPLTIVTIRGQGFDPALAGNVVRFNGTVANVLSGTSDTLLVNVPVGATTGPISVSAGGVTVTSTTNFITASVPVITSVIPNFIDATRPPAGLQITGANLTGATFSFLPGLQPPLLAAGGATVGAGGTTANVPITVAASARGRFTLVATTALGSSDAFPSRRNALWVINAQDDADSDGDGFPDGLELLFGSDPTDTASVPDLTSRGDVISGAFSVANTLLPQTTEQIVLSSAFSVSNTLITPTTPQEILSSAFSVSNTLITPTTPQEILSSAFSVSNTLLGPATMQQLIGPAVSVLNVDPQAPLSHQLIQSLPAGGVTNAALSEARALTVFIDEPSGGQMFIEGQTTMVTASVSQNQGDSDVTFTVNGVPFAADSTPPHSMTFTVPSGIRTLTFGASVRDAAGETATATSTEVPVERDGLAMVTGRVVDAAGNPVQGAVVELLSEGLKAEFFDYLTPLDSLPDLTGATPIRSTRVTALNTRNPSGVFGSDPLGANLAPDYAARFSGWVTIANPGSYTFFLGAHEGARLRLGGTTVVAMSSGTGSYQEQTATINLAAGLVPIEVTFFESAGFPELQLSYIPPGGERQVVPPSVLVADPAPFVLVTDDAGQFMFTGVPKSLTGIQVRATSTRGNKTSSGITSRVAMVSTTEIQVGDIEIR